MSKFIRLTDGGGVPLFVQVEHIVRIQRRPGTNVTYVGLSDHNYVSVKEDTETIMNIIYHAQIYPPGNL